MRVVRVLFLKAVPGDPWVNRLVSALDPPFCHVEIEFDMSDERPRLGGASTMASSIFAGESVFLRPRSYANPNYTIITLNVSDAAFARMYRYAENAASRGTAFSNAAMYLSLLPGGCHSLGADHTFCSAYVTSVLQAGGVHETLRLVPARTRPSTLHRVLSTAQQQSFSTVPYKMNLLRI
jgi:hypothetical protein